MKTLKIQLQVVDSIMLLYKIGFLAILIFYITCFTEPSVQLSQTDIQIVESLRVLGVIMSLIHFGFYVSLLKDKKKIKDRIRELEEEQKEINSALNN